MRFRFRWGCPCWGRGARFLGLVALDVWTPWYVIVLFADVCALYCQLVRLLCIDI